MHYIKCFKTATLLDTNQTETSVIVLHFVKYICHIKLNNKCSSWELSHVQRLLQALNSASLRPQRLMKAFLSFLHICSDTTIVFMQQQQVYKLPFALLPQCISSLQTQHDRFIFLFMHLRTAGKHLRLFKRAAAELFMSLYYEQMISTHMHALKSCVNVLTGCSCSAEARIDQFAYNSREGSCLTQAFYQQRCGCSCQLIRIENRFKCLLKKACLFSSGAEVVMHVSVRQPWHLHFRCPAQGCCHRSGRVPGRVWFTGDWDRILVY